MSEKKYSIAIDGPSGAGKSTLAKAVAAELGIVYVDTGALYRSVGYYVWKNGIDPKDAEAVAAVLPHIKVDMCYSDDGLQHMLLCGEDITDQIRLPQISMYASAVSAIPAVRDFLLDMQRDMAKRYCVIMDGRDIGTVVLPDADVKIFLTADAKIRAQRRMKELEERGTPCSFEEVLSDIEKRDWADSHRETAPLRQAEDAILVDNGKTGFEESKQLLLRVIREALAVEK